LAISSKIRVVLIELASLFYFKKRSKAIFYHDIHAENKYTNMSTPIALFKEHIQIIRDSGYEIVSKINKPTGQIEISFDDGFLGIYENINVIKELDVPIQLFVISSNFDAPNYINKSQLLELNLFSHITISSHTHKHSILNKISVSETKIELETSKKLLENILNKQINSLCFPEGKFNKKVIEIAKKMGYSKLYASIPGFYFDQFSYSVIKRSLVQFAEKEEFKAILKGGDHILSFWYKMKHFKK
jgi:peptidoglycan/xylan/chitin deacetylase (PgdA/CDA1 family)